MQVKLKGIHAVRRQLAGAGGRLVTYYYAWRGGPRLVGEPGSPEFLASYQAALSNRRTPDRSLFRSIIVAYRGSPEFAKLAARTAANYTRYLTKIKLAFAELPLEALDDPRVTRDFLDWRDGIGTRSPSDADNAWKVLMRLISWARGSGLTTYRPPERIGHLYHADRSEKIWTEEHVAAFMAVAPDYLQRVLVLALETGQRQVDLLQLAWSAYDGQWIRLRQRKTGRKVNVPVTRLLRSVLENTPRNSPVILTNSLGRPWLPRTFREAWLRATRAAGIDDLHFHDLRGTAVTRLAEAGCTEAEIATITGHSLASVHSILECYLARTDKLAIAAIAKLERDRQ
jgi:integrase